MAGTREAWVWGLLQGLASSLQRWALVVAILAGAAVLWALALPWVVKAWAFYVRLSPVGDAVQLISGAVVIRRRRRSTRGSAQSRGRAD